MVQHHEDDISTTPNHTHQNKTSAARNRLRLRGSPTPAHPAPSIFPKQSIHNRNPHHPALGMVGFAQQPTCPPPAPAATLHLNKPYLKRNINNPPRRAHGGGHPDLFHTTQTIHLTSTPNTTPSNKTSKNLQTPQNNTPRNQWTSPLFPTYHSYYQYYY